MRQVVEPLAQFGAFDLKHLYIWDRATLVVVDDDDVAVRDDVVGGLYPERVALGLACARVGFLIGILQLYQDKRHAISGRLAFVGEVQKICFGHPELDTA